MEKQKKKKKKSIAQKTLMSLDNVVLNEKVGVLPSHDQVIATVQLSKCRLIKLMVSALSSKKALMKVAVLN